MFTDNIKTPEGAQTQACTARGGTDFREQHCSSMEPMSNTAIAHSSESHDKYFCLSL